MSAAGLMFYGAGTSEERGGLAVIAGTLHSSSSSSFQTANGITYEARRSGGGMDLALKMSAEGDMEDGRGKH